MFRVVPLCLFFMTVLVAQNAAPSAAAPTAAGTQTAAGTPGEGALPGLAALEQNVKDRTAEWSRLSQNLESSLIKLLPCDAKVATAISEVNRASTARIEAVAAYLDAATRQALLQTSGARQVLASVQSLTADVAAEKSTLDSEHTAVDRRTADLAQSAQRRPALSAPSDTLKDVRGLQQQRSDAAESAANHTDQATATLRDLVTQLQTRETAWKDIQTAFQAEGARWDAYYVARQARAQTECLVVKGPTQTTPVRPSVPAQGKQK